MIWDVLQKMLADINKFDKRRSARVSFLDPTWPIASLSGYLSGHSIFSVMFHSRTTSTSSGGIDGCSAQQR
jgi:hypothetical protein